MNLSRLNPIAALALLLASTPLMSAEDEAGQLALLKNPDATLAQKQDACRELALVGTAGAVPVLASLLGDPELSHMARHALEPIPDPSVDVVLRAALGTVQGRPLLGVIASIGVRGDEQAVPALAMPLTSPDPAVADAAARAIGEIGTAAGAKLLQSKLKGASQAQLQALCEGLLRCAESLEDAEALAIYDLLRGLPEAPHQIRTAALRGSVLSRGNAGLPLMMEALSADDWARFHAALRISMELKSAEVTAALAGELTKLPADRQALIVQTLGLRGDATAAPALMKLLETADTPVRVAAMKALTRLAHIPVVPQLAKLSLTGDGDLAAAAKVSLASFPDKAADAAIMEFIENSDSGARCLGTELVAGRSADIAVPTLLKLAATDQDDVVRVAALKVLRELAGLGELDPLLKILLESESKEVIQAARHALVVVCVRQKPGKDAPPPPACVDPLVAALENASGPAKAALLDVLRRLGGPKAEEAIRSAKDGGKE